MNATILQGAPQGAKVYPCLDYVKLLGIMLLSLKVMMVYHWLPAPPLPPPPPPGAFFVISSGKSRSLILPFTEKRRLSNPASWKGISTQFWPRGAGI